MPKNGRNPISKFPKIDFEIFEIISLASFRSDQQSYLEKRRGYQRDELFFDELVLIERLAKFAHMLIRRAPFPFCFEHLSGIRSSLIK